MLAVIMTCSIMLTVILPIVNMLSIVILSVIMLAVVKNSDVILRVILPIVHMLSVIMLAVFMLSDVLLRVAAPFKSRFNIQVFDH